MFWQAEGFFLQSLQKCYMSFCLAKRIHSAQTLYVADVSESQTQSPHPVARMQARFCRRRSEFECLIHPPMHVEARIEGDRGEGERGVVFGVNRMRQSAFP